MDLGIASKGGGIRQVSSMVVYRGKKLAKQLVEALIDFFVRGTEREGTFCCCSVGLRCNKEV